MRAIKRQLVKRTLDMLQDIAGREDPKVRVRKVVRWCNPKMSHAPCSRRVRWCFWDGVCWEWRAWRCAGTGMARRVSGTVWR